MSFVWTVARRCNKNRSTQRQLLENICSEEDSIRDLEFSEHLFLNFLIACLSLKGHLEFSGAFFLVEIFQKVSFDPYNFRITRLSARKSEQVKNFWAIKMPISTV